MAKRASVAGQKGSVGQTAVKLAFEQMGWGPIPVTEHDSGTDFFIQVRDRNLFELGLLVGVQVKNEKKYFKSSQLGRESAGWHYEASQDDTSYWLNHTVPHVLVLYDRTSGVSYWTPVRTDTVRWTDKGARIWIPAANALDSESRQPLLDIATAKRASPTWSGSSWDELGAFDPRQRLRMALMVPRIAAPHGNRTPKVVTAEEAIATLMKCDFWALQRFEHEKLMPTQAERLGGSLMWRLYEGLSHYLQTASIGPIRGLACEQAEPGHVAGIHALLAALMVEQGEARSALSLLETVNLDQLTDPVDRAWIETHLARCRLETGHLQGAEDLAFSASAIGLLFPDDPTAVTLRSSALQLVDVLTRWAPAHFEAMVRADDTAPRWWRGEQRAWALTGFLEDRFQEWGDRPDKAHKEERDAWQRLRSVVSTTGVCADHHAWCQATNQLAQFELLISRSENFNPTQLATILRDLRLSGGQDDLKVAVDKIEADGPCDALTQACHVVSLNDSTRTTFIADVELISRSADLVAPDDAERHVRWALAALMRPEDVPATTYSRTWIHGELTAMIRALWWQLGDQVCSEVTDFLVALPIVEEQADAEGFAQLVDRIPASGWSARHVESIRRRLAQGDGDVGGGSGDHGQLTNSWRSVLLRSGDLEIRDRLLVEVADGSYEAIVAIGQLSELSPEAARGFITHLHDSIAGQREDARQGHGSFGGPDGGSLLLKLNLLFRDLADWDPIQWILEGPSMPMHQVQLLDSLAQLADRLSEDQRRKLVGPVRALATANHERISFFTVEQVGETACRALFQLESPLLDWESLTLRLASGADARCSVADAIGVSGGEEYLASLISLSVDEDSKVRAAAAEACVNWLLRGVATVAARRILERLLLESGRRTSIHALRPLTRAGVQPPAWLLQRLVASPSAVVRRHAQDLLDRAGGRGPLSSR